jgi:hypothetical protein
MKRSFRITISLPVTDKAFILRLLAAEGNFVELFFPRNNRRMQPMWFRENNKRTFAELEAKAQRIIREGNPTALGKLDTILHIYIEPSFHNYIGYTAFWPLTLKERRKVLDADLQPAVQRIIWRRPYDFERSDTTLPSQFYAVPTLIEQETELNRQLFDELMQRGSQIAIPVIGLSVPWGLDGVSYGLCLNTGFMHYDLVWWQDGPTEWRPLTQWVKDLIRFFDTSFDEA